MHRRRARKSDMAKAQQADDDAFRFCDSLSTNPRPRLRFIVLNHYLIILFLFYLRQSCAHSWSFSWFQNSRRANLRLHRSPRCVAFGYTAAKHAKQTILLLWERRLTLFKTLDCYFVNCSNTSILARARVQRFVLLDTLATEYSRCLLVSSLRLPTHLAAQHACLALPTVRSVA